MWASLLGQRLQLGHPLARGVAGGQGAEIVTGGHEGEVAGVGFEDGAEERASILEPDAAHRVVHPAAELGAELLGEAVLRVEIPLHGR